jgi:hypothetical protein
MFMIIVLLKYGTCTDIFLELMTLIDAKKLRI